MADVEIITVNSEGLQAQIRNLLPSQAGFGAELAATNVITPIIDLTAAAEGANLRQDLQTAIAYQSETAFSVVGTTSDIINTTGFYRIFGCASGTTDASNAVNSFFTMETGGSGGKIIWQMNVPISGSATSAVSNNFDFVVFLAPGESIKVTSANTTNTTGCTRQIADIYGNLINPTGYTAE